MDYALSLLMLIGLALFYSMVGFLLVIIIGFILFYTIFQMLKETFHD